MKVLVTGANGFVGTHVVMRALERSWDVRGLCLPGTPTSHIERAGAQVVRGDITKPDSLAAAMAGVEVVFHVAGSTAEWHAAPRSVFEVNAIGTRNVCRAAMAAGVGRLVHTSSAVTVGSAAAGRRTSDEEALWDLWDTGIYARSKFLAEREALQAGARGLDVVVVCPHQMLGAYDFGPSTPGRIVVLAARGKVPFYVRAESQLLDVEDAAHAHLLAAERGRRGERYVLAGPEPVPALDFLGACASLTGAHPPRIALPPWVVWIAAHPIEWLSTFVTRRPPLVTIGNARMLRKRMVFSIERARRDLGFEPGPWRAAIEKAVRWFDGNGYLGRRA